MKIIKKTQMKIIWYYYLILNFLWNKQSLILSSIIILIYLKYSIASNIFYLDGESIYELDGRPVQLMDNISSNERQDFPNHSNPVYANQGDFVEWNYREAIRYHIPNPAHYPSPNHHPSTLLGSIHSSDPSYQMGEVESRRWEPTRSEMEREGIYFGTNIQEKLKASHSLSKKNHTHKKNPIIKFIKCFWNKLNEWERKQEASALKYREEQRKINECRRIQARARKRTVYTKSELNILSEADFYRKRKIVFPY